MKHFGLVFLFFWLPFHFCFSQDISAIKIYDSTIVFQSTELRTHKYWKKNILKGRAYNDCGLDMKLRFGISHDNKGNATMVADNIEGETRPQKLKLPVEKISAQSINDFLDSTVFKFSNGILDICVANYILEYSEYVNSRINTDVMKSHAQADIKIFETTFPPDAVPNGKFVVTKTWASFGNGGTLYLPKNFTIVVANDVDEISWYFDKVVFDSGATIDLSRRVNYSKPSGKGKAWSSPHHNDCDGFQIDQGANGSSGSVGISGKNGTDLTLETQFISKTGNLWIRTDGGNGGEGGDGQDGGDGSKGNCSGAHYHNSGSGGNGGGGGKGGNAGRTSTVKFTLLGQPVVSPMCSESCPNGIPSVRPGALTIDGAIVAYGVNGCPGLGGLSGIGGDAGGICDCGIWHNTTGANNGNPRQRNRAPSGNAAPKCQ